MTDSNAKSVRAVFMRTQIGVSLTVLSVVTSMLVILLLALMDYRDTIHTVDLAQSIESRARIAKSPLLLQQAISELTVTGKADAIMVYSKTAEKLLASSAQTNSKKPHSWIVSDPEIRQFMDKALVDGVFGTQVHNISGRRITILPLAPQFNVTSQGNVIIGQKWPTPAWHKHIDMGPMTQDKLFAHIFSLFNTSKKHLFKLRPEQYGGLIVIETNRTWFSTLAFRSFLLISTLLTISVLTVVFSLSRGLQKHVLKPINQFSGTIAARASGDYKARVPDSGIEEFDKLAAQWNSLLNYRETAQAQNLVLSTLLDHVPVGIEVTDAESKIEYANPAYLEMTGYSLADIIGKTPELLASSSGASDTILGDALVAIANGETWTGEITSHRKDKTEIICNVTLVPIFDREDQLERVISLRHDITSIKANEADLITAKTKAQQADKAKSEFLANMSHELRTPLNSIIGFSEIMSSHNPNDKTPSEFVEFAKMIEKSSRSLLASINSILEISRFDTDQLRINIDEFSPARVLDKVIESKADKARKVGVEIIRNLDPECKVKTDERLLRQTASALLCNAIRFNREGGTVEISCKKQGNETVITFKDTGIGISAEELPLVTMPFYRVDTALNRQNNGVGLSLALVRKFAEAQNICFDIQSKEGEGTTVTLTFFCGNPQAIERPCRPVPVAI